VQDILSLVARAARSKETKQPGALVQDDALQAIDRLTVHGAPQTTCRPACQGRAPRSGRALPR
jgi:hypothetical protein